MKRSSVAVIDEARCIGCTLCIDACPVDAIVGAEALMHTVVEPWCIGCGLCLPPCPVDCIAMLPAKGEWTDAHRRAAGRRGRERKARLLKQTTFASSPGDRRAVIAAALARKRRP
jgi:Na+-translocating ferredoxin:NAD+ oxidoreductase subunit B